MFSQMPTPSQQTKLDWLARADIEYTEDEFYSDDGITDLEYREALEELYERKKSERAAQQRMGATRW